jgi:hypothetical protein
MSVNWEEAAKRYVVRFRDVDGRHRTVTVNAKNLDKYGLSIPTRITERVANCQSNLKQWGTIFAMYTDDNNGFFPKRTSGSGRWINVLYDYYSRDDKIRVCPMATKIKVPVFPNSVSNELEIGGDAFTSWCKIGVTGSRPGGEYGPAGTWVSYGINH